MTKSHVITAQTALAAVGLYTDAIDGEFGKGSLYAVQQLLTNVEQASDALAKIDSKEVVPVPPHELANYILSERSLQNLKGVKPDLVKVVKRAIQITSTDFMVNEGLRSRERQSKLVKSGASQTMNSNHLKGAAVDIVPVVNGKADFANWDHYYPLATAMQKAADELGINVRWGGMWALINAKPGNPKEWVASYVAERKAIGKSAFIDGPHFELG